MLQSETHEMRGRGAVHPLRGNKEKREGGGQTVTEREKEMGMDDEDR